MSRKMLTGNSVLLERKIEIKGHFNVIVIGGGSAGICASMAAAGSGASTLLIEKGGYLGGIGTSGAMVEFGPIRKQGKRILGGIPYEIMKEMRKFGGAELRTEEHEDLLFTPESFASVSMEMCLNAGVEMLLHTRFIDCVVSEGKIEYIIVDNKEGTFAYAADIFIDCSGDGDVFFKAGLDYQTGRESDNKTQPMTLVFFVENVDYARFRQEVCRCAGGDNDAYFLEKVRTGKRKGTFKIPIERPGSVGPVPKIGRPYDLSCCEVFINGTNIMNHNGVDAKELTEAEIVCRRQVYDLYGFFKAEIPGFENCYISHVADSIGVRETRKLKGKHILSMDDLMSYKYFDDTIAIGFNMIDIHQVEGEGFDLYHMEDGKFYSIPYNSLISDKISNLITAGRCISATHEAIGAIRVMVNTMPVGEAAGTAAGIAVKHGYRVQEVDIDELRTTLLKNQVILAL